MPRIYIPNISVKENQISIAGDNAKYLVSVLRCKKGDELIVFDGEGNSLRTEILKADRKEVIADVIGKVPCDIESPINLILVLGLLKGQKMDMVIQKATELGVKEIMPVITERCQSRETRKVGRWRKIAEEASRQCGRTMIPFIHEPVDYVQFLGKVCQLRFGEIIGLIFWEEGELSVKDAFHKISSSQIARFSVLPIYILIGPEGGFTKEEVSLAEAKGFIVSSLGKRILRAETAAISAVVLIQFLLGALD
ncbi:MAG: 16S rRNA (uracil(1498)-N(3))-methyltransferase [Nitrospirae bacterium]|nr:16S rRNA (uracil(1498)-N(3))-methyltransferase [Nitrospirota bacterium]